MVCFYLAAVGIYARKEEVYFPIREINLSQPKKSVKWHSLWNSLFHTSNIVSLRLGPYLKGECIYIKKPGHTNNPWQKRIKMTYRFWVCAASSKRSSITMIKC